MWSTAVKSDNVVACDERLLETACECGVRIYSAIVLAPSALPERAHVFQGHRSPCAAHSRCPSAAPHGPQHGSGDKAKTEGNVLRTLDTAITVDHDNWEIIYLTSSLLCNLGRVQFEVKT